MPTNRSDNAVRVALITAPDSETGARIARSLVEERLAACVNLVPEIRSIYRWQGKVEDDSEVLLVVKTSEVRVAELARRLRELHPYDVPELVTLPAVGGLDAYLDWVRQEASP